MKNRNYEAQATGFKAAADTYAYLLQWFADTQVSVATAFERMETSGLYPQWVIDAVASESNDARLATFPGVTIVQEVYKLLSDVEDIHVWLDEHDQGDCGFSDAQLTWARSLAEHVVNSDYNDDLTFFALLRTTVAHIRHSFLQVAH